MTNGEVMRKALNKLPVYYCDAHTDEKGGFVSLLAYKDVVAALGAPVQADAVTDAARVSGGGSLGHATSTLPTCIPESVQAQVGAGDFKRDDEVWIRGKVMTAPEQGDSITVAPYCVANYQGSVRVMLEDVRGAARPEVGAGIESPDKLTMASITCPDCKAIHPIGGCTDYLREKRLARSVAARPDVADSHLLDKLNEAIVDTIYLDNGRVIDIKGADIRTEIKRWLGILKPL